MSRIWRPYAWITADQPNRQPGHDEAPSREQLPRMILPLHPPFAASSSISPPGRETPCTQPTASDLVFPPGAAVTRQYPLSKLRRFGDKVESQNRTLELNAALWIARSNESRGRCRKSTCDSCTVWRGCIQTSDFEGAMTVSGSHEPVRASSRPASRRRPGSSATRK
jgi:hypothetical protein